MPIPDIIKKEHIISAIERIKKEGYPRIRESKKYLLDYEGKFYPPKLVLSYAYKEAVGVELLWTEFKGGKETNKYFIDLDFNIKNK